jgi:quercetin dioxygenase-like cupin family protein
MTATHPLVTRNFYSRAGAPLAIGPDLCRVLVDGSQTGGALAMLEWTGAAPGGPPLHVHPDQDEVFLVCEGRYRFQCGDGHFELEAGDTIFLPRAVPHTFAQLTPTGRLVYSYAPAGQMVDFFAALAALGGTDDHEAAGALFASHGMQIVGPPLPAG